MAGSKDAGGDSLAKDILRELRRINRYNETFDKRLRKLEEHLGVPKMTFTNHPYLQRSEPESDAP